MVTDDEITEIVAKCVALQAVEGPIGYDTKIVIDSFSFVWLQQLLEERFGFDLEQPGHEVMQTLNSA